MLFDLGVSSPQLGDPARGFSFRHDGPLDMRMDPEADMSAADWLATAEQEEIRRVIRDYGEERFAQQIAAAIVAARRGEPLLRTRQLADLVARTVRTREPGQDPATRTFQAVRIHVNRELEEVSLALPQATAHLAAGGRLAVISFHSLEDRIVKRFFQAQSRPEVPRKLPLRASEMPQPALIIVGRAAKASPEETQRNPRARSAILRVAERTAAPYIPNTRIEPDARSSSIADATPSASGAVSAFDRATRISRGTSSSSSTTTRWVFPSRSTRSIVRRCDAGSRRRPCRRRRGSDAAPAGSRAPSTRATASARRCAATLSIEDRPCRPRSARCCAPTRDRRRARRESPPPAASARRRTGNSRRDRAGR